MPKCQNLYIEYSNTEHTIVFLELIDIFVLLFALPSCTINPCEYLPAKFINITFQSITMSFSAVFWPMMIMGCYWQPNRCKQFNSQLNKDKCTVAYYWWNWPEQVSNLATCNCFFWRRRCEARRCQTRLTNLWFIINLLGNATVRNYHFDTFGRQKKI